MRRLHTVELLAHYDGDVFSYRHVFHAGNHADVLKHLALLATLRHLMQKPAPITLIDTHAGAGCYRIDSAEATRSGEAQAGVLQLRSRLQAGAADRRPRSDSVLHDYLALVQRFNAGQDGAWSIYPGSPAIVHALMTEAARSDAGDRLQLFEWHPTVHRLLSEQVAAWSQVRRVAVHKGNGFAGLKGLLPPPAAGASRRAFVLIDPSYELKTDYDEVRQAVADALKRFATGVYLVWYPRVAQPGAHELPRRLKALADAAGRDWLHAVLDVGHSGTAAAGAGARSGLAASGVFVINPPYTLAATLRMALPVVTEALARGAGHGWQVERRSR